MRHDRSSSPIFGASRKNSTSSRSRRQGCLESARLKKGGDAGIADGANDFAHGWIDGGYAQSSARLDQSSQSGKRFASQDVSRRQGRRRGFVGTSMIPPVSSKIFGYHITAAARVAPGNGMAAARNCSTASSGASSGPNSEKIQRLGCAQSSKRVNRWKNKRVGRVLRGDVAVRQSHVALAASFSGAMRTPGQPLPAIVLIRLGDLKVSSSLGLAA